MLIEIKQSQLLFLCLCILSLIGCSRESATQQNNGTQELNTNSAPLQAKTSNSKTDMQALEVTDSLSFYGDESLNELVIINKNSEFFSREGKSLKIKNKLGKLKTYTNEYDSETPPQTDEDATYSIIRFWPQHSIVAIGKSTCSGECFNVLLIDLNLDFMESSISGFPSISQDGTRVAAFNVDLFAGFLFNGISVYKRSPSNVLTEEYTSGDGEWGVDKIHWKSNQSIEISTKFQCKDSEDVKVCEGKKLLNFINDKWIVN